MKRVSTVILTRERSKHDFDLLMSLCHNSKNLYNASLYVVKQAFLGTPENIPEYADIIVKDRFVREFDLTTRMAALGQSDYRSLKAQCAQQVVKKMCGNVKAYFKALKEWKKNPGKFVGKPRFPKYRPKSGCDELTYTNQSCTFDRKTGVLNLGKDGIIESVILPAGISDFQQVRIVPREGFIQVEIIYNKENTKEKATGNKSIGIDLGVDNLATVTSDGMDIRPIVINGRSIKSINQFYNKRVAELQEIYSKHGIHTSKRIKRLGLKRKCKLDDYFHNATAWLVRWCLANGVGKVYIGRNKEWKQECNMGKKSNQNFVQIPFWKFIRMLKYKCDAVGIELAKVEEAYTSNCSALDKEEICKHEEYAGRRIRRGLFRTADNHLVNADVNGSLNILRLGLGRDFDVGGKVFNPIKINEFRDADLGRPADRGSVADPVCYLKHTNVKEERLTT